MKQLSAICCFILFALYPAENSAANSTAANPDAPAKATIERKERYTDYAEAQKAAQEYQLPMLLYFSGSDWCAMCQAFAKNIESKPEFAAFIKSKVIFVYLDFPEKKPQSKEEKVQNARLARTYKVEAFPTFVVISKPGKVRKFEGFNTDWTPKDFIGIIEKSMK